MFVELLPLLFFLTICVALMLGYPVAFTLMGVSFFCAGIGMGFGVFDGAYLSLIPNRLYGVLTNQNLIAIPLFIFMGTMLEKSNIAEALLKNMSLVFMGLPGGLGISTVVVGTLLAASTGIVGATVVAMGILSLPTMLRAGYKPSLAASPWGSRFKCVSAVAVECWRIQWWFCFNWRPICWRFGSRYDFSFYIRVVSMLCWACEA
jgi:TRAP-type mannitol/chloroaromatic compound transport system permease large subunit